MENKTKELAATDLKKVLKVYYIICNEPRKALTLAYLSRRAKMKPRQLINCYKAYYHMTPRENILSLKGCNACLLLGSNRFRIYEITHELGYATYQGFSRMFKKQTGLSPSGWQRRYLAVKS